MRFQPVFVEFIPEVLEPKVLYVSMRYRTAAHLCASGCGEEVVTPLGRDDWTLVYDGTVSLRPSIGNFGLPCRSHYFVSRNVVVWARSLLDHFELNGSAAPELQRNIGVLERLRRRLKGRPSDRGQIA